MLKLARENFPSIIFHETSDFKILKSKNPVAAAPKGEQPPAV